MQKSPKRNDNMEENIKRPTTPEELEGMEYEVAIKKLKSIIITLERDKPNIDEYIELYKEAFVYYAYCTEYLKQSKGKVQELSDYLSSFTRKYLED